MNEVPRDKFEAVLAKMLSEEAEQEKNSIMSHFDELDHDKSGGVSKNELMRALFKMVDKDEDGELSNREIHRLIRQLAKHWEIPLKRGWWRTIRRGIR